MALDTEIMLRLNATDGKGVGWLVLSLLPNTLEGSVENVIYVFGSIKFLTDKLLLSIALIL